MGLDVIEISPEARILLRREVIHAYKSIPRRGAETGGLICGALTPQIRIDTVVPIPIEYRFGPAYRLSDLDQENFRLALKGQNDVIGWYRSQTRVIEGLAEEDREVARLFFGSRESAFLICVPDAQYNVDGRLHLWAGGKGEQVHQLPLGKFSLLEDALRSTEEENEPQAAAPASRPLPGPALSAAIDTPLFLPAFARAAPPKQLTPVMRAALVGGIAVALLGGAAVLFRSQSIDSPGSTVHANNIGLGMKVDRQGQALLINWDRQSAAVLEATDATFTISEGTHSRVLRLSTKELHNGGVLYTPQSGNDVQVELALHGPGGNFAQSLRIVQDEKIAP